MCYRHLRNLESVLYHLVLLVEVFLLEKSTKTPNSIVLISVTLFHDLHRRLAKRIKHWLIFFLKLENGRKQRLRKLRLHGYLPKSPGLFQFQEPRNWNG